MLSLDHLSQIITQLWPSISFVGRDADVMITIDADLQDDPDKIPEMIEHYKMAVRSSTGCALIARLTLDSSTTLLRASIN